MPPPQSTNTTTTTTTTTINQHCCTRTAHDQSRYRGSVEKVGGTFGNAAFNCTERPSCPVPPGPPTPGPPPPPPPHSVWQASLPAKAQFTTLLHDGVRAVRARYPNANPEVDKFPIGYIGRATPPPSSASDTHARAHTHTRTHARTHTHTHTHTPHSPTHSPTHTSAATHFLRLCCPQKAVRRRGSHPETMGQSSTSPTMKLVQTTFPSSKTTAEASVVLVRSTRLRFRIGAQKHHKVAALRNSLCHQG
jgi:hypothetical protein